jgi:hypothetical protein
MSIRFRLGPFTFGRTGTRLSLWNRGTGISIPVSGKGRSFGKVALGPVSLYSGGGGARKRANHPTPELKEPFPTSDALPQPAPAIKDEAFDRGQTESTRTAARTTLTVFASGLLVGFLGTCAYFVWKEQSCFQSATADKKVTHAKAAIDFAACYNSMFRIANDNQQKKKK